jgi:hypothetical protein
MPAESRRQSAQQVPDRGTSSRTPSSPRARILRAAARETWCAPRSKWSPRPSQGFVVSSPPLSTPLGHARTSIMTTVVEITSVGNGHGADTQMSSLLAVPFFYGQSGEPSREHTSQQSGSRRRCGLRGEHDVRRRDVHGRLFLEAGVCTEDHPGRSVVGCRDLQRGRHFSSD